MRAILASVILLVSGCASVPPPAPPAYTFRIVDEPENRRFVFEFVSQDDRALCVNADEWTFVSAKGAVAGAYTLRTLNGPVEAKAIYFEDAGMVCGRSKNPDCGTIRVEPRQGLRTEVGYDLFPNPDELATDVTKRFDLHPDYPFVSVCKAKA